MDFGLSLPKRRVLSAGTHMFGSTETTFQVGRGDAVELAWFAMAGDFGYTQPALKAHSSLRTAAILLAASLGVSGCTTSRYLAQASCGQVDLLLRARDLDGAVRDPALAPRTRALLGLVAPIKRFGEEHSLRPTGNYRRYVALDRKRVVWVVSASESLRFHSKTWWFPIVGSVPYLGWFDRDDANEFARDLREGGWDVDVGGAEAYSTLGWFQDPVLSTMLSDGPDAVGSLANVVLHESVHATLYIDGQTRFNESLAEFAANKLTVQYLSDVYGPSSPEKTAFVVAKEGGEARAKRLHVAYEELERLYASNLPREAKLAEKTRLLTALRDEISYPRPITNATLSAFKNYHSAAPEFDALYLACEGDYRRFFLALSKLKDKKAFSKPNQAELGPVLAPLVSAGCPR